MIDRRKFLMCSSLMLGNSLFSGQNVKPSGFKRLVCMSTPYGMVPDAFFPKNYGLQTVMPDSLKSLTPYKDKMTIFGNLDHGLAGGHYSGQAVFSGVNLNEIKSWASGAATIDQRAAQGLGHLTRLPYISLRLGDGKGGRDRSFWTKIGIEVPAIRTPEELYSKLFLKNSVEDIKSTMQKLDENSSLLDFLNKDISSIKKRLNNNDRNKIEEFTASLRDVEKEIDLKKYWLNQPVSKVNFKLSKSKEKGFVAKSTVMMDLLGLAFETDSTRIATVCVQGTPAAGGIDENYHGCSHHGNEPHKLRLLQEYEEKQISVLSHLVKKLSSTPDRFNEGSLLDNTIILFGSGMSNPSTHSNRDLPIFAIGGGLKHQGYIPCKGTPLSNLYVSTLQYLGLEIESFGRSTGTFSPMQIL